MKYTKINSTIIDKWVEEGWKWGIPISHEEYLNAKSGNWKVYLTPTKPVPRNWFPSDLKNLKVLGLASGGGQQMPIFASLGALVSVLDLSTKQLETELEIAKRENYKINIYQNDMTEPLPFQDETFDIIFHPVSNCYIENVRPLFKECFRVLKNNGILLCGLDNGINYITFDEITIENKLPFNPLEDKALYDRMMLEDNGIQFSHTLEEQIGGQLEAGFTLVSIYEDTNGEGRLHELNIPSFIATKAVKFIK